MVIVLLIDTSIPLLLNKKCLWHDISVSVIMNSIVQQDVNFWKTELSRYPSCRKTVHNLAFGSQSSFMSHMIWIIRSVFLIHPDAFNFHFHSVCMKQAHMASTITDACRLRQEHNHYIICPSPEPIISVYSAFHFLLPCFASVLHLYFQRIYHTSACPSCRKAPSVNSPPAIESSVAPFASACFIEISVLILYARAVQNKKKTM